MVTDIMAFGNNLTNQFGVLFGYPAEDKKGGFDLVLLEKGKDNLGTAIDPIFEGRPIFNGHPGAVVDVEPFFEVDGKNIQIIRQGLSRCYVAIV